MNHQPYETWILDESELSAAQKHELLNHLEICSKCASLQENWKSARQEIKALAVVNAPAGFSKRWNANLAEKRKAYERHQIRTLLICLVSSAVAIIVALGIFLLPHTSMISLLVSFFTGVLQFINSVTELYIFITSLLSSAPTSFLVGAVVVISLCISLISIIWAISFYRITMKGTSKVHEK